MSPFCYFLASSLKGKNFALACAYVLFELKWELLIPKKEYAAPNLQGKSFFFNPLYKYGKWLSVPKRTFTEVINKIFGILS